MSIGIIVVVAVVAFCCGAACVSGMMVLGAPKRPCVRKPPPAGEQTKPIDHRQELLMAADAAEERAVSELRGGYVSLYDGAMAESAALRARAAALPEAPPARVPPCPDAADAERAKTYRA
jgi:hypothetical protein